MFRSASFISVLLSIVLTATGAPNPKLAPRQSSPYIIDGDFSQPVGKTWQLFTAGSSSSVMKAPRVRYEGNYIVSYSPQCSQSPGTTSVLLRGNSAMKNVKNDTPYIFSFDYLYTEKQDFANFDLVTYEYTCKDPTTDCPRYTQFKFKPAKYQKENLQGGQWYTFSGAFELHNAKPTLTVRVQFQSCGDYFRSGSINLDNFRITPA